jgi:4-amino-4-deoxy-L-arabinose transferase-like glycosyltransferase
MMRMKWSRETWILISILAAALAARLYQVGWGLPYVYEEATPLKKAWVMWEWGSPHGVDLNPHFFNYPSLTIYLQFLAQGFIFILMKITGVVADGVDYHARYIVDPTPVYYAGRLISVLFGAGTVWLTWLVTRRFKPENGLTARVAAALLVAVNTYFISRSHLVEVDVPLTFFVMLVFWLLLRLHDRPTLLRYITVGSAIGLAASTKYTGAMLMLPLVAVYVGLRVTRNKHNSCQVWWHPAAAVLAAVAAFLLTSPYVLLDYGTFVKNFGFEREHMQLGHFGLRETSTWIYYAQTMTGKLIGWPAALFALGGLIYATLVRKHISALVMAAFVIPYLVAVSTWSMHAERYLLPVLPPLLVFAAVAIGRLAGMIPENWNRPKTKTALVSVLIAVTAWPVVAGYPAYLRTIRYDSRTFAADWIESSIPAGSYLVTEAYGPQVFKPQNVSQVNSRIRDKVIERKKGSRQYAVLQMPMFQTVPERSGVFYDFILYENVDYFITTGSVKQRYADQPALFARQMAFYDSLETTCRKITEVTPGQGGGSTITVYKNLRNTMPFAARDVVAPPMPLRTVGKAFTGSEELYYNSVGLNYEVFTFLPEAIASYDMAFRYPVTRPASFKNLVLRKTRCLLALDELAAAVDYLDVMIPQSPTPPIRDQLIKLNNVIKQRIASREQ